MMIIIWTITLTVTYMFIYTLIYTIFADSECYVQEQVWLRSLSTITERSIQYILWMYPIIWLFWPKEIRCSLRGCCRKKRPSSSMMESGLSGSQRDNSAINSDEDTSSSEEGGIINPQSQSQGTQPRQTMIKIQDAELNSYKHKSTGIKTGVLVQQVGEELRLSTMDDIPTQYYTSVISSNHDVHRNTFRASQYQADSSGVNGYGHEQNNN